MLLNILDKNRIKTIFKLQSESRYRFGREENVSESTWYLVEVLVSQCGNFSITQILCEVILEMPNLSF